VEIPYNDPPSSFPAAASACTLVRPAAFFAFIVRFAWARLADRFIAASVTGALVVAVVFTARTSIGRTRRRIKSTGTSRLERATPTRGRRQTQIHKHVERQPDLQDLFNEL
jgi:hypothetical protein